MHGRKGHDVVIDVPPGTVVTTEAGLLAEYRAWRSKMRLNPTPEYLKRFGSIEEEAARACGQMFCPWMLPD